MSRSKVGETSESAAAVDRGEDATVIRRRGRGFDNGADPFYVNHAGQDIVDRARQSRPADEAVNAPNAPLNGSNQSAQKRKDATPSELATKVYDQSKKVVAARAASQKAIRDQAEAAKSLIRANTAVEEAERERATAEAELGILEREHRKEEIEIERRKLEQEKIQLEKRLKEVNDAMRKTEEEFAPASGRLMSADTAIHAQAEAENREKKRKGRAGGEAIQPIVIKEEDSNRSEEDVRPILRSSGGEGVRAEGSRSAKQTKLHHDNTPTDNHTNTSGSTAKSNTLAPSTITNGATGSEPTRMNVDRASAATPRSLPHQPPQYLPFTFGLPARPRPSLSERIMREPLPHLNPSSGSL